MTSSMEKWWLSLLPFAFYYVLGVVSSGKGFWKHTFISTSLVFGSETVKTHRSWSRYHAWPVHLKRDMSYTMPLCLWMTHPKTFNMYLKIYRKKVAIGYWNLHTLGYPFTGFPTSQRLSVCNPGDKKSVSMHSTHPHQHGFSRVFPA